MMTLSYRLDPSPLCHALVPFPALQKLAIRLLALCKLWPPVPRTPTLNTWPCQVRNSAVSLMTHEHLSFNYQLFFLETIFLPNFCKAISKVVFYFTVYLTKPFLNWLSVTNWSCQLYLLQLLYRRTNKKISRKKNMQIEITCWFLFIVLYFLLIFELLIMYSLCDEHVFHLITFPPAEYSYGSHGGWGGASYPTHSTASSSQGHFERWVLFYLVFFFPLLFVSIYL